MSIWDAYGAPQFGLNDCKVAMWNATDDYDAAVDVPGINLMGITLSIVSARAEGDDKIVATASRITGGRCRIKFSAIDIEVMEVLCGLVAVESNSTPNRQTVLQFQGGDNMPYIGICGKVLAEEGTGDMHFFIPKGRIMSDFQIAEAQYGQFLLPELEFEYVEDATYGLVQVIPHETITAVAIPPVQ